MRGTNKRKDRRTPLPGHRHPLSRCRLCNSPARAHVELAIMRGIALAEISRRFTTPDYPLTPDMIEWHKKKHMSAELKAAVLVGGANFIPTTVPPPRCLIAPSTMRHTCRQSREFKCDQGLLADLPKHPENLNFRYGT